jgi:hypothetical protein
MLEKVFYTSVLVSDQDKALDFYTTSLALRGGLITRHQTGRGL